MAFINRLLKALPNVGGRAEQDAEQDVESGAVQDNFTEKEDGAPGYATTNETFIYNELVGNKIKITANTRLEKKANFPKDKDYEKGYFMRYFVKRYDKSPVEVDSETLQSFKDKSGDSPGLYNSAAIKWHLSSDKLDLLLDLTSDSILMKLKSLEVGEVGRDISKINERYTRIADKRCPGILGVIDDNYTEFTVEKGTDKVESYLYTNGSEFKRPNGQDYVGYYHIHSRKGAMVGATHSDKTHDTLISVKDLDTIAKNTASNTSPAMSSNSSEDSTYSAEPSGGGGDAAPSGGGGNTLSY